MVAKISMPKQLLLSGVGAKRADLEHKPKVSSFEQ